MDVEHWKPLKEILKRYILGAETYLKNKNTEGLANYIWEQAKPHLPDQVEGEKIYKAVGFTQPYQWEKVKRFLQSKKLFWWISTLAITAYHNSSEEEMTRKVEEFKKAMETEIE